MKEILTSSVFSFTKGGLKLYSVINGTLDVAGPWKGLKNCGGRGSSGASSNVEGIIYPRLICQTMGILFPPTLVPTALYLSSTSAPFSVGLMSVNSFVD